MWRLAASQEVECGACGGRDPTSWHRGQSTMCARFSFTWTMFTLAKQTSPIDKLHNITWYSAGILVFIFSAASLTKGPFINYVRVPREGGGFGKIPTYSYFGESRSWWSHGNLLTSRSKVREFKSSWGGWIFQDVKILSTSPPGGTLSWGSRVLDFRLVKEPQAWKNRPVSKI